MIRWTPKKQGRPLLLASASFDATVRLWEMEKGTCLYQLSRHEDPVYSVAFSPCGDYLATGSFDKNLHIWSVKTGKHLKTHKGESGIFEVCWNKDGTRWRPAIATPPSTSSTLGNKSGMRARPFRCNLCALSAFKFGTGFNRTQCVPGTSRFYVILTKSFPPPRNTKSRGSWQRGRREEVVSRGDRLFGNMVTTEDHVVPIDAGKYDGCCAAGPEDPAACTAAFPGRSKREVGTSYSHSNAFKNFIERLRSSDPTLGEVQGRILRLKRYLPDIGPKIVDAVIDALSSNTVVGVCTSRTSRGYA